MLAGGIDEDVVRNAVRDFVINKVTAIDIFRKNGEPWEPFGGGPLLGGIFVAIMRNVDQFHFRVFSDVCLVLPHQLWDGCTTRGSPRS